MDQNSKIVSAFYDQFPFPGDGLADCPPPGYNWRWCFDVAYSSCTGALPNFNCKSSSPKILDAGCGTGVSTDYLAHLNPGAEIVAIDISKKALDIASERLLRSGAKDIAKVSFENQNLFNMAYTDYFDFINSVGVLHHLDQPAKGLKKLDSLIKKGGILHIFLYAESGRREIRSFQRVLSALGAKPNDEGVNLARKLLFQLPKSNPLRRNYDEKWSDECALDVNFADMYLHPQEVNFTLDSLFEMIGKTDLIFLGFSNPKDWDPSRFLSGELLSIAKSLPLRQQWKLIEDLDLGISHFEFFLAKNPLPVHQWGEDSKVLSSHGRISPCLWGWPGKDLLDRDLSPLVLTAEAFEFLDVLHSSRPGTLLRDLPLGWPPGQIASTARDLQLKYVLLLSPG